MTNVFARLVIRNPLGITIEALLFALALLGVLVMLVGSVVSLFLSGETWAFVLGAFQGILPTTLLEAAERSAGGLRLFYVVLGGFALLLLSTVLGMLYNLLLVPLLLQRNLDRLERKGFTASQVFPGRKEWAVLDTENRYAFFLTAARALQIHASEVKKFQVRSMPVGRQQQARIELTDPETPHHEIYFPSKDEVEELRAAIRAL